MEGDVDRGERDKGIYVAKVRRRRVVWRGSRLIDICGDAWKHFGHARRERFHASIADTWPPSHNLRLLTFVRLKVVRK